jgi:multiple sugar transport system substrate-binding protein
MNFKKILTVLLISTLIIALILTTFIFIPSESGGGKIGSATRIYYADNISEAHQKVIDRFNEIYKDQIEVVAVNLPFTKFSTNERKELLARFLRSRSDRIDIFSVDQIWVPRFAKWSLPLDRYFDRATKTKIIEPAAKSSYLNDTLFAIPLYIDVSVMYYRDDLLKKISGGEKSAKQLDESISWEDFIELKSRSGNEPFFLFQAADYEGLMCIFLEMMRSLGKELIINDSLQLHTPEAKKALTLLCDIVQKYNMSPDEVTSLKENQTYDKFFNENYMFLRGWPGLMKNFPDSVNYKINAADIKKVPTPHFGSGDKVSVYGGWNLMISQYSSRIYESVKFIEFLLSEEAQLIMYEEGGYLPVINSLYEDHVDDQDLQFYRELLDHGVHRPFTERYTGISDILSFYINKAIKGDITVEAALHHASDKINSGSIFIK